METKKTANNGFSQEINDNRNPNSMNSQGNQDDLLMEEESDQTLEGEDAGDELIVEDEELEDDDSIDSFNDAGELEDDNEDEIADDDEISEGEEEGEDKE